MPSPPSADLPTRRRRAAAPLAAGRGDPDAGDYQDVPGFCKAATLDGIGEHGYILTPGRYVGIGDMDEDDEPFDQKFPRLRQELDAQFAESQRLEEHIRARLGGLGRGI